MAEVSATFFERWASRKHVGPAAPAMKVEVTRGLIDKTYQAFKMLDGTVPHFMKIVGGKNSEPWQGFWRATGSPITVPNVLKITWDHKLSEKGARSATVEIENISYDAITGAGGSYHAMDRGALSPTRGAILKGRPTDQPKNSWYEVFDSGYRIDIWEGYGEDQMVRTFCGIVDHAEPSVHPDRIILTCRSFFALITDQQVMGWNKAPEITGPKTTFADESHPTGTKSHEPLYGPPDSTGKSLKGFVLVKDLAAVAKTVFMWAGYHEWKVENLGWSLAFPMSWTMEKCFIDVLDDLASQANWVAYEESPSSNAESIGVPCFVHNRATDPPHRTGMLVLTHDDMLEETKPVFDSSVLPYIIISRGKASPKGRTYFEELIKRCEAVYFPPWSGAGPRITEPGRTTGVRRHEYMLDHWLLTDEQCMFAALLEALQFGLQASTCQIQIAGTPEIELNTQISIVDDIAGVNSRLWVSEIHSEHTSGKDAAWKMTVGGSLIDTIDMQQIGEEIALQKVTVEDQRKFELR
jgi:hypothetical protein